MADPATSDDTRRALEALTVQLEKMNEHRYIRAHNSFIRLLFFQFARGVAFGLGTLIGATLLLSVVAWSLAQVEFIPIIGEWAALIAQEINLQLDPDSQ